MRMFPPRQPMYANVIAARQRTRRFGAGSPFRSDKQRRRERHVLTSRIDVPALGRRGTIARILVRSEGGRIYCDVNELPRFVKP
jgi:hypothetical protein